LVVSGQGQFPSRKPIDMTPALPLAVAANPLFCLVGLVQLIGLLVAGSARFTEGTPYEQIGQWACLVTLGIVGTMCGVTLPLGPGIATTSAVTLTLMTMIVIVELPRRGAAR
jgi:hypothetical protein